MITHGNLLEQDQLPDVDVLISNTEDGETDNDVGIFVDDKGHADEILVDLGTLVWGKVIYDIDPDSSYVQGEYQTDIEQIASDIVLEHTE